MRVFLLCFAIILLFAGHLVKVLRWRQFVGIYETTGQGTLIRALAYGYLVNYILPFHIGDLVRAFWAGRTMENGTAFSLATVIMDRCLDVWAVGLIFVFMYCTGTLKDGSRNTVLFYIFLALVLVFLLAVSLRYNKVFKRAARGFCAIFNDRIELSLLMFFWSGITAVKDMLTRINKKRLLLSTACMWMLYLLSYYMMSLCMSAVGYSVGLSDIVLLLFDSKQLNVSAVQMSQSFTSQLTVMMAVYILTPLLLLVGVSALTGRLMARPTDGEAVPISSLRLLPQAQDKDKLRFLESYFAAKDRAYLKAYIQLNQDVTILEDYSAGSNATTMLCMNEDSMFYRKYVFGREAAKLAEQIQWLEAHKEDIPLPDVMRVRQGDGYCCYDMPYHPAAIGMFQYIHSADVAECWELLKTALTDLQRSVYQRNVRRAESALIDQYIEEKVLANFTKIELSHELGPLLQHETLIINEKEYQGYPALKAWMNKAYLKKVFSYDSYADIHGDLTVENIVCMRNGGTAGYYLIDPNTGNLHESPFLDYSKLLQSLHGGYEFLMRTDSVNVSSNEIRYLSIVSQKYSEMLRCYRRYLGDTFTKEQVRSIYCHEIVHWLRLMPYKIRKNGKLAAVFFAGMIIVFNDVKKWCGEIEHERPADDP